MANLVPCIFTALFLILLTTTAARSEVVKSGGSILSFNFTNFTTASYELTLQGNASVTNDGILSLTNHDEPTLNTGRALYKYLVPIWDSTTGNVASFVTSFSFIVNHQFHGPDSPGDGIIFFLSPPHPEIPNNSSVENLGVVDKYNAFNQFVGVEFDNHITHWNAHQPHVGIDVSSLISLKTMKWNRKTGSLVRVSVIYDSVTNTLTVVVTDGEYDRISTIAQVVDLKAVLPELVSVGFSATTKWLPQTHDLLSWSFSSTLETTTQTINNIAAS